MDLDGGLEKESCCQSQSMRITGDQTRGKNWAYASQKAFRF